MTATVLSTKKLLPGQKALLLNSGIALVERNFITIRPLNFEIPDLPENIIFTSKNAVKIVLSNKIAAELKSRKIFCVGEKTAATLANTGLEIAEKAQNASALAEKIVQNYKEEDFLFFCGKKRREELSDKLKNDQVVLNEIEVYDTHIVPKRIDRIFDGVLFFSPSAVTSFFQENKIEESVVFCIGTTTAAEAKKYSDKIVVASKPTIENVIVQVVKHLSQT